MPIEENIKIVSKKETILVPLSKVLRVNQMVLFYETSPEEIKKLSKTEINKRLYKIIGFEGDGRLQFRQHSFSMKMSSNNKEEMTIKKYMEIHNLKNSAMDFEKTIPWLRLRLSNIKAIFEDQDFILHSSGKIDFII